MKSILPDHLFDKTKNCGIKSRFFMMVWFEKPQRSQRSQRRRTPPSVNSVYSVVDFLLPGHGYSH